MTMGASEILATLEKGEELTSAEIAGRINLSHASVKDALRRLMKDVSENLDFRLLTPEEKETKYGRKVPRGIRVYLLIKNE